MRHLYHWGRRLWRRGPCRWLLAAGGGAVIGVTAGHTVIGSVSGSVSVVSGTSMAPTFQPGARVYTAPIAAALERGDIVLLDDGNKDYALKRIVGLPGENVQLWRGRVFINRKMLHEPYLPRHTYTFPDERSAAMQFTLGDNEYFVLGDNRVCSVDSRAYGPVQRQQIKSRIPDSAGSSPAHFVPYTLPANGKRTIQPLLTTVDAPVSDS
jgi:signal peptidase I